MPVRSPQTAGAVVDRLNRKPMMFSEDAPDPYCGCHLVFGHADGMPGQLFWFSDVFSLIFR